MNPIYWYADEPSRHQEIELTTYHSLTGDVWLDLLIVTALLVLPVIFMIWSIEGKDK